MIRKFWIEDRRKYLASSPMAGKLLLWEILAKPFYHSLLRGKFKTMKAAKVAAKRFYA